MLSCLKQQKAHSTTLGSHKESFQQGSNSGTVDYHKKKQFQKKPDIGLHKKPANGGTQRESMGQKVLPQVLIIGAKKCGTSNAVQ